jgi:hypothetical protein
VFPHFRLLLTAKMQALQGTWELLDEAKAKASKVSSEMRL